jgi:twitching motility two-component system response regulator PilH
MPPRKILVVDDSPTDRRLVVRSLQQQGYTVVTAVDGEDALDKASAEQPDLIVLDVILPKLNGFAVCRELKADPHTKNIPIILLTSKTLETDRYWGLRQGADGYMIKPFADEELLASVGNLL